MSGKLFGIDFGTSTKRFQKNDGVISMPRT